MAVTTSIAPRQKWWNIAYAAICLILGLWGAWDYFVTIPRQEERFVLYQVALAEQLELEDAAKNQPLEPRQIEQYNAAKAIIETFGDDVPELPAAYDRPVQLWLYIIGCGILGTPFFIWNLISLSKVRYHLADDASLECPEGVFTSDQIKDIDMSKWMAKSKAWLIVEPDKRILLDDYKFKNMHVIVGYFASRFHPDDWTGEAKPIKQEEAAEPGGEDAESPSSAPD